MADDRLDPEDKEKLKEDIKKRSWWLIAAIVALVLVYVWGVVFFVEPGRQEITYTQFLEALEGEKIKSVTISGFKVNGEFREEVRLVVKEGAEEVPVKLFTTQLPAFVGEGIVPELTEKGVAIDVKPPGEQSVMWQVLIVMLPWVLIIGIWWALMRRTARIQGGAGGLFTFAESRARKYEPAKKPGVTFKDVAGLENAKAELRETIEFLKDPARFKAIGAKVPKGVLLVGPPGTGKTLLARAVAGEAGVNFFSISASEFIEMFVGVGASRVRDLFKKARENQPSIIFVDELDSVGRTRGTGLGGGHDEREQTLNQLLAELDGFESHEEVIVMAATNRPDVLDPALLRPGRFDRHIVVDRPGMKDRVKILEVHVRNKKVDPDVDLDKIARGTPGMTGADLENLANEAALVAARKGKDTVHMEDFEEARDKVLMGAAREEKISEEEKRITAYHETGHAVVAHYLPGMDPIHKVTIIPRGFAMGATQLLPTEDRHYYPKTYLINKLTVALAGRVAERMVFNDVSTGAQNDLKEATGLAEKMVGQWGMSEKIGPLSLGRGEEHPFLGRELAMPKRYSEDMAWLMDQEIRRLILEAETKAEEILKNKRHILDRLADTLVKEEVLDREEIERIIKEAEGI